MDDYDLWMARFKDPDGHIVALRHEVPKGLQADGKLIETTVADTRLDWPDLITGHADLWDGAEVEISGWVTPIDVAERHDYFLLVPQPACCIGCLPSNPSACVEVFTATAIAVPAYSVRLAGRWRRLVDDPAGWRYQLCDARLVDPGPTGSRNAAHDPFRRRIGCVCRLRAAGERYRCGR